MKFLFNGIRLMAFSVGASLLMIDTVQVSVQASEWPIEPELEPVFCMRPHPNKSTLCLDDPIRIPQPQLEPEPQRIPTPPTSIIEEITELSPFETKKVRVKGLVTSVDHIGKISYRVDGDAIWHSVKTVKILDEARSPLKWNWIEIIKLSKAGKHTIKVRVIDSKGDRRTIEKDFFYGPPTTKIIFPSNTHNNRYKITWDRQKGNTSIRIKGETTDPTTNIKSIQWRFKRNNNQVQDKLKNLSIISSKSVRWEFESIMLRPENHTIEVIARDDAGNEDITLIYIGIKD